MEQMNLFDMGAFFGTPTPPTEAPAKKAKASSKKKDAKKTTSPKKEKWETFTYPVEVVGPNFSLLLEGEGEIGEKEVSEKLVEMGIAQFKANFSSLKKLSDNFALAIVSKSTASNDDMVDMSVPLIVSRGMCQLELTAESFSAEGKVDGEISIKDIIAKWVAQYPRFEGCSMVYDSKANIAYPLVKDSVKGDVKGEIHQIDCDLDEVLPAELPEAGVSLTKLAELLFTMGTSLPSGCSLMASKNEDDGTYIFDFAAYNGGKDKGVTSGSSKDVKGKKKDTIIPLPVTISYQVYEDDVLNPSDFEGKEKIPFEEIKAWIRKAHKAAFSSETGGSFDYFKDVNKIYAAPSSAKKG